MGPQAGRIDEICGGKELDATCRGTSWDEGLEGLSRLMTPYLPQGLHSSHESPKGISPALGVTGKCGVSSPYVVMNRSFERRAARGDRGVVTRPDVHFVVVLHATKLGSGMCRETGTDRSYLQKQRPFGCI